MYGSILLKPERKIEHNILCYSIITTFFFTVIFTYFRIFPNVNIDTDTYV